MAELRQRSASWKSQKQKDSLVFLSTHKARLVWPIEVTGVCVGSLPVKVSHFFVLGLSKDSSPVTFMDRLVCDNQVPADIFSIQLCGISGLSGRVAGSLVLGGTYSIVPARFFR